MAPRSIHYSPDIRLHLEALGLSRFAVTLAGPLYQSPCHVMSRCDLLNDLGRFARRNDHAHQHVYIQGVDEDDHDLILIGPSWRPLTDELRAAGHDPAAVVEVGPEHFETWIRLGEPVPQAMRGLIAQYLNWFHRISERPQDALRRGYLAGFECRKFEGSLPNGHYPRVRLLEATGNIAQLGRVLIQTADDLREEMFAASARALHAVYEAERDNAEAEAARREAKEQIAEYSRHWLEAYEDKWLGELSGIDQAEVLAAFEHHMPRDLVIEVLARVATRKGSGARAYAETTVAGVYDRVADDLEQS